MKQLVTDGQGSVVKNKDNKEYEDTILFDFFDDGTGSVNIGGIEVDVSSGHSNSAFGNPETTTPPELAEVDDKRPESVQFNSDDQPVLIQQKGNNSEDVTEFAPTDRITPNLSIFAAAEESVNSESGNSVVDDLKAQMSKSAKLLEETRSRISNHQIKVDHVVPKEPSHFVGSLDIEDETVEAVPLPSNLDEVEAEYDKSGEKVGGLVVDGATPAADTNSTTSKEPWLVRTFIVAPIRGLFRALYYHGLRDLFGFFGNLLKFALISGVITVGVYIVMAHYSDSGLSAVEMAMQHYAAVKKVVVTLWSDVSSEVRGNEGQ